MFTYHALLTTFFTIRSFDVEYEQTSIPITIHPDALGRLLPAPLLVHDFKGRVEK